MNIGFIGFGDVAYQIAQNLYKEGLRGIRAHDTLQEDAAVGRLLQSRAKEAHVTLTASALDLAQWADVIFSAVPSFHTLAVCKEIKGCLRKGKLFVDLSASTPVEEETIWKVIKDTGVYFVDVAMPGGMTGSKHGIPMTASGNGAELFKDIMTPYHMDITLAGRKPGAASALYREQASIRWDRIPASALSAD